MTTSLDNEQICNYLKASFDCTFFQSFSETKETLYIDSFNKTFRKDSIIYVYFKTFKWTPIFVQTSTKDKLYYIENISTAPIIEFSKSNWEKREHGRIYWSKYFSGNPEYNIKAFELIYNDLIKWIKKSAGGHLKLSTGDNLYFFKDAWTRNLMKE